MPLGTAFNWPAHYEYQLLTVPHPRASLFSPAPVSSQRYHSGLITFCLLDLLFFLNRKIDGEPFNQFHLLQQSSVFVDWRTQPADYVWDPLLLL